MDACPTSPASRPCCIPRELREICIRPSSGARRALSDRHDHCETIRPWGQQVTTRAKVLQCGSDRFSDPTNAATSRSFPSQAAGERCFQWGPDGGLNIWLTGRVGCSRHLLRWRRAADGGPSQPTEGFALNTITSSRGPARSLMWIAGGRLSVLYTSELPSQGRRSSKRRN